MAQVVTVGCGTAAGAPDRFVLHAGLASSATSPADALHRIAELQERLRRALDEMGVAAERRSTTSYSVHPIHDHRTGGVQGYEGSIGLRLVLATLPPVFLAAGAGVPRPVAGAPEIEPGESDLHVFVTGTWELEDAPA